MESRTLCSFLLAVPVDKPVYLITLRGQKNDKEATFCWVLARGNW